MFSDLDLSGKNNNRSLTPPAASRVGGLRFGGKLFLGIGIFLVVAAASLIAVVLVKKPVNSPINDQRGSIRATSTPTIETPSGPAGRLPAELVSEDDGWFVRTDTDIKAEDLSFGMFYDKPDNTFQAKLADYSLPLNTKTDVLNYYEVARKIDLDGYLDSLNRSGFALVDNPFNAPSDDFFSLYRLLMSKKIPIVLTGDFMMYYFQNTLKTVYKEIEQGAYFSHLWDLNYRLYSVALVKYRDHLESVGTANDPVLEGERLELAYFAVVLKLLEPTEDQIDRRDGAPDKRRFTPDAAEKYRLELPNFLADDVMKEIALIRAGKVTQKSPVFLYNTDYSSYRIPDNYQTTERLENFYLASKWLNSVFPLYYRNDACPECLLDQNDWVINLAAAVNISEDIYRDQNTKNQWAVIYKLMSYFTGLRRDLTFLHYHDALVGIFGENYDLDAIFASDNPDRANQLSDLQDRLAAFEFLGLEGGLDRSGTAARPGLGLRLLQERFWPDDYVFSELTGTSLRYNDDPAKEGKVATLCYESKKELGHRCRGVGLDPISVVYPDAGRDSYALANAVYLNYPGRLDRLREAITKFDSYTWNGSFYWSIMDLNRRFLGADGNRPVYMLTEEWKRTKETESALGAWLNMRLPEDPWNIYYGRDEQALGVYSECNQFNYIEPNLALVEEMAAKNIMLSKMVAMLEIVDRTNTASLQLRELNKQLTGVAAIIRKELSSEPLDGDDCRFIADLAGSLEVEHESDKKAMINFADGKGLAVSLENKKLLAFIANFGDKKAIVFGPVFDYKEVAR